MKLEIEITGGESIEVSLRTSAEGETLVGSSTFLRQLIPKVLDGIKSIGIKFPGKVTLNIFQSGEIYKTIEVSKFESEVDPSLN